MTYDDHEPGLDPEPLSSGERQELDNLRDELHKQHSRFRQEQAVRRDQAIRDCYDAAEKRRDEISKRDELDPPAYHSRDTVAGPWNGISLGDD